MQLGEVITIDRTAASEAECRTLPYVGLEHIEKDAGHFYTDFRRKPETLLAIKYRFTARHVLYGKLRPYLNKVVLPDFTGVCTTEIFPLIAKPERLDRGYLYAVLLSQRFVKWASNSVSGANLPRLDPDRLREYEFELPDLSEQRRIAARLEQADRLRRTRRYALELTDTFLPAAFLAHFGDRHRATTQYTTKALEELVQPDRGVTYGIVQAGPHIADGVPYIKTGDIIDGVIRVDGLSRTTREIADSYRRSEVKFGDLVMSIRATVGTIAVLPETLDGANLTQGTARIAPGPEVDKLFLLWQIRMPEAQRWISQQIKGSTFLEITLGRLREMPVFVPALPLQQKFAALVERVEQLRAVQREALRQADHLFASLLHCALSG